MTVPNRKRPASKRSPRSVIAAGLLMAAIASCSSDETSGPSTEPPVTPAPTTTVATTSQPTTTTTPPETTTTTTTTAPPATEPPETTTTTTTTAPVDPLSAQAAEAEVLRLYDLEGQCWTQLPNCDADEFASNYAGPLKQGVRDQVAGWVAAGNRIENIESRQIFIESSTVNEGATQASVITCDNSGAVLLDAEGNVLDDLFESFRDEWFFTNDSNRWVANGRVELESVAGEGNTLCDA